MAAWARVGMYANNSRRLDDAYADGVFVLLASADVNRYLKLDMGLIALFNPDIAGRAELLDGILRFELHDLFNIWAGRMLVPSDRSTFSGPWFMAAWNYPGFYPNGLTVLPRSGPFGRNDGLTAWGQVAGGKFKYYAGAYDLHDRSQAPLFSGRLVLNLLSPEPGYYNMSTYYGANILAIGLAGQAKRRGSIGPSSAAPGAPALPGPTTAYYGVNADVLFEKKLAGNVLDLEGAYYYFHGEYEPVRHGWFALASFLVGAKLGIGQVQPLVRVQRATPPSGASSTLIDAQLGYVMGGPGARLALGYQHGAVPGASSNTVFLGAQLQK